MTNPAVSSISVDSKEWVGELSVKQLGPWMDYALLLVNTDFVSDLIFLTTKLGRYFAEEPITAPDFAPFL